LALRPGQTVTPEPLITLRPKGGLHMTLAARQPLNQAEQVLVNT
jgi:hypothetical protein